MDENAVLRVMSKHFGFNIRNACVEVEYLKANKSLYSKKGYLEEYGHSVGAYRNYKKYFVIEESGAITELDFDYEQLSTECKDYGVIERDNIGTQIEKLGLIPLFIVRDELLDMHQSGRGEPYRKIIIWSI